MDILETRKPQVKVGCYCRISSDPADKRAGVDRQREDTTDICAINGWTPVDYYVDNDRSATSGAKRDEWSRLLGDIEAGRINAIVVWNQDRGWRKMSDLESLRPVLEPLGVLLATTNIGVIDFSNADDVFRAQVSTAMSEMEVAKMKVRMRRAARQKAEQGRPQWKKAFGYLPDTRRKEDDDGTRQIDEKVQPLVAQAYTAVTAGSSLMDIARLFNGAEAVGLTGRPWTASTVSLFLRAPRNAGLRAHNNEIVGKGTWPPLVEEKTWNAAQAVLNAPGRAPGRKSVRRHPLTGVMRCGKKPGCTHSTPNCECARCDGHLNGNWQMQHHGGGPRAHSIVYSCKQCHGVSVRAEHVEPLLRKLVGGRLAMSDAEDLLKAEVQGEAEAEAMRVEKTTLYAQIAEAEREYDDGIINGRRLAARIDRVNEKLAVILRQEQDAERLRVLDGIPLGRPEAVATVLGLSEDRFRAVIDLLAVITVDPVGKGSHVFDRRRVQVRWHQPIESDQTAA
jgi:DNA invertase Pin-like site-specific DNA recombinase